MPAIAAPRGAPAAWAWPLAGLAVGALAAGIGSLILWAGAPAGVAAAALLAVQILATGGLHEDGLADTADGLWGGQSRERRLEIMKDSRIGSYGTLALLVTGLARWSALAALLTASAWPAVLAVAALSRAPMALAMAALPNARGGGLAQTVGRPAAATVALCGALALAIGLALCGPAALALALAALVAGAWPAWLGWRRIGGQTGDILGACQQMAEVAALATAAGLLA